jgi:hypothetical protein
LNSCKVEQFLCCPVLVFVVSVALSVLKFLIFQSFLILVDAIQIVGVGCLQRMSAWIWTQSFLHVGLVCSAGFSITARLIS